MAFAPGTRDGDSVLRGPWSDAECTPLGGSATKLGSIPNGNLTIVCGYAIHKANDLLEMPDVAQRNSAGMEFDCLFEEHNVANWSLAMGLAISATDPYLDYVGHATVSTYHTLKLQRSMNATGFTITALMNKSLPTTNPAMGSTTGDAFVGTGLKFVAFRDTQGVYSNSNGGNNRLGWLLVQAVQSTAQL